MREIRCYVRIFNGTGNSAQLCQNFGISGGLNHSNPPRYATDHWHRSGVSLKLIMNHCTRSSKYLFKISRFLWQKLWSVLTLGMWLCVVWLKYIRVACSSSEYGGSTSLRNVSTWLLHFTVLHHRSRKGFYFVFSIFDQLTSLRQRLCCTVGLPSEGFDCTVV
jgi:hypothetical protein